MITLRIDGAPIEVAPGTTVLEAALSHGKDIPHLCYHPALSISGGCRLCLVEIEGRPVPAPSCGLPCEEGMNVTTESERLTQLRRDTLDLFVSDHPLRCVTCDKNGACELQYYAYKYGIAETSYQFELSRDFVQDDNPMILRDHQYCILCGRCVRVCDEVVGANAIDFVQRGFTTHVGTPFNMPLADSSCVFCGNCVQVCPTAALMHRTRIGRGREWELAKKRTVCGYCGVGCRIEFRLQEGEIVSARGFREAPVNGDFLCVKGRFGWDFAQKPDRLTRPLIRRDLAHELGLAPEPWTLPEASVLDSPAALEHFVPVSWETALDVVSEKLAETVRSHGGETVAGLASARCTNEENYLFQKLLRASLGSNHVDHCARLCHASTVAGLLAAFGGGAMTNPIGDIRHADCIFITGSNTAEAHPVISYEVIRAVRHGASLIVVDPRHVPLVDQATLFLQPRPGTDVFVFLAMLHVILREGWADQAFIDERTEGFETFARALEQYTPELAAMESGVAPDLIEQAARLYALGQRQNGESIHGDARGRSSILYAMGITQRSNGTQLVQCLANLAMLCGQVGKPSAGVNPLRGQSNVQGACDMGGLPNYLPGYQAVGDKEKRKAVAKAWGLRDLPSRPGLTVVEIMQAAEQGKVRALYVMGENPMLSDPNLGHVEQALRSLDFLVVQDIFLNETAALAHVVLPAASWLEKDGTMTNTERRVQELEPVLPAPGEARPDWAILCALGARIDRALGSGAPAERWSFRSTAAILDEIASVTPIYGGVHRERLGEHGLVWPCPTADHPGTPILHVNGFSRGKGKFHTITSLRPVEQPDQEYPLILTTGRILYHYHTGTMTRRSEPLSWRETRSYAEINEQDAAAVGVRDAGPVIIRSRRGAVRTQARVSQRVPPGVVFLAFHWRESPANLLTHDQGLDPQAKIPEFKISAVRLESPKAKAAA